MILKSNKRAGESGKESPNGPETAPTVELTISWKTILKVLLAILLAVLAVQLRHVFADIILALLIAITLWPVIFWTRKRRWPKWSGVTMTTLILVGSTALILVLLIPTVTRQGAAFIESLPGMKAALLSHIPPRGAFRNFADEALASPVFADPKPVLEKIMALGVMALSGFLEFLLIITTAIYLLADGERVYGWLLAFLPERQRQKVKVAAPQVRGVVSAYMGGQLLTSLLVGAYVFCVLAAFHVPNATLLAVLAAIFDVLPLIGFFLTAIPAIAAASFVSPHGGPWVGVLYTAYHLVESYVIVPKIYGDRLRLSSLTVLVCCMMAAVVAGVVGVLLILPIVASYPIIEKVWLKSRLQPDTVQKHATLDGG